ncbi:MAG: 5-formyltetrahydrofolate cyclo-ligase [Alphaproteobacteria bacterium]
MDIQLQKNQIRQKLRQKRRQFEPKDVANQKITENLAYFIAQQMKPIKHIGLYYPMASEVSLLDFSKKYATQYSFYLPKVVAGDIIFSHWDQQSTLTPDELGILAPSSQTSFVPTLICVPLLGFTAQRQRIGQGAGYYDRYIAHVKSQSNIQPIYLGVAFECQKLNDLPIENHDQKLDYILTESNIY